MLPHISSSLTTSFLKAFSVCPVVLAVVSWCFACYLPFYWLRSLLPLVFMFLSPCKGSICTASQISSNSFGIPPPGLPTFCCLFLLLSIVPLFPFFLLFPLYLLSMPFPLFLLFLLYSCSFILTYCSVQRLYLLAFVRFFSSVLCQVRFEYGIHPEVEGPFLRRSTQSELSPFFWKSLVSLSASRP